MQIEYIAKLHCIKKGLFMIIKSSNAYWGISGVIFCFGPIIFVLFLLEHGCDRLIGGIIIGSICILHAILLCMTYCRTLIMDKEGCTVKFLRYKKAYKWSELETKCIVDSSGSWSEQMAYNICFVFCKKQRKNPRWLHPALYSLYFHPLSFMFVCFDPHLDFKPAHEEIYLVEEDEFLQKMAEWNVEIVDERNKKTGNTGGNTSNTGDG